MTFKVGDTVRFITTEPDYEAVYYDGNLTVTRVYDDGDLEVCYPADFDGGNLPLSQSVSHLDVRRV